MLCPDRAAAADPWAGLAELPRVAPARVITIPTRPSLPRFTVGGPVVRRGIAVVASSQFGFAAAYWRRGTLAWTKPAGIKVAPPIVHGEHLVLVGDCVSPPAVPDGEMLLGCLRAVTIDGTDQAYIAIHGAAARVEPFAPRVIMLTPQHRRLAKSEAKSAGPSTGTQFLTCEGAQADRKWHIVDVAGLTLGRAATQIGIS